MRLDHLSSKFRTPHQASGQDIYKKHVRKRPSRLYMHNPTEAPNMQEKEMINNE